MFKIQIFNKISPIGLKNFPKELYEVGENIVNPDAILVRSQKLLDYDFPPEVKVVGRAGAGVNNIPIDLLTKKGIPVLNTPGANANAVCELVIASMLLVSRNICAAWLYVKQLNVDPVALSFEIEKAKKEFVGGELIGKTLGIVGLGSIGVKVANAALGLGMQVIGYDPGISVNRAWELSSNVQKAQDLEALLACSDFISIHVPLTANTNNMIDAAKLKSIKNGAILLNFSREGIIDENELIHCLNDKKIKNYVTDFPSFNLKNHPAVISLPHLGASTLEAEENCAMMLVKQIKDFLEIGTIHNSVNFPEVSLPKIKTAARLIIVNENIPNMVAQISSKLASSKINISSLVNQSRNDIAYTVIDLPEKIHTLLLTEMKNIPGVLQVRQLQ